MPRVASSNRCQHLSALGRRCRERRSATHPSLCAHHARQDERHTNADPETLAADLLGPERDYLTSASVNRVLGKLLRFVVTQRISPRNAAVTAYICQLLLQSLPGVKDEIFEVKHGAGILKICQQAVEDWRKNGLPDRAARSKPAPRDQRPVKLTVVNEEEGSTHQAVPSIHQANSDSIPAGASRATS